MIEGVREVTLQAKEDARGQLIEVYRQSQVPEVAALQLNIMSSRAGSLRGCHVHTRHWDYFVMANGEAIVGARDVRQKSSSFGQTALYDIDRRRALVMPPGVVHAVWFPMDATLVTVESRYFDPTEEFKVDWTDPKLAIPWPEQMDVIAAPTHQALSFSELMIKLQSFQNDLMLQE